jgi:hypothetical protein
MDIEPKKKRKHAKVWNAEKFQFTNDRVEGFISNQIIFQETKFTTCNDLFLKFKEINNLDDLDSNLFFRTLQYMLNENYSDKYFKNTTSKGKRGYRGFYLNQENIAQNIEPGTLSSSKH